MKFSRFLFVVFLHSVKIKKTPQQGCILIKCYFTLLHDCILRVAFNSPSSQAYRVVTADVGIYVTGRVLKRNTEVHSSNHCCSEKTLNTTYPECVFVALVIQHGELMCHIDVCGLSGSTIFVHIIS